MAQSIIDTFSKAPALSGTATPFTITGVADVEEDDVINIMVEWYSGTADPPVAGDVTHPRVTAFEVIDSQADRLDGGVQIALLRGICTSSGAGDITVQPLTGANRTTAAGGWVVRGGDLGAVGDAYDFVYTSAAVSTTHTSDNLVVAAPGLVMASLFAVDGNSVTVHADYTEIFEHEGGDPLLVNMMHETTVPAPATTYAPSWTKTQNETSASYAWVHYEAAAVTSCAVSGTVVSAPPDEGDIVAGGKTIILTLTGDVWVVAAGGLFDAERQNIIDGLDSAQSEGTGWNAEVRDNLAVTTVVRTSDTIVTITLSAQAAYDITSTETITVTVPSTAMLLNAGAVVASPTFNVTAEGASTVPLLLKKKRAA